MINIYKMEKQNKNQSLYGFMGMNKCLSCIIMLVLLVSCSILGYIIGLVNINEPPVQTVTVEVKNDSTLLEVIRSQTKIEMEMLRIIGEKQNTSPTIKNNIVLPNKNCLPQIENSFNNNTIMDSLK